MTRTTHRAIIVRAALAGALLVAAAAIAQNALDAALDANTRVGGTGYNPGGRGNAASLRASSFRLDRGTGEVRDAFGGNSAFSRPEYRVSMSGAGARGAAARAGLTRDQVYPSTQANLRQDDVQRRMQGGGFAPNDFRGANRAGGLQTPVYQPYSSTSYANPEAVGRMPTYGSVGGGGGRAGRASNRAPSSLAAPSYRPGKR